MKRLELWIAWRYLRSRRGSRLLSLISVIAIGGVVVGVSALIVIIGVMNGLQTDLREKILIGSPDIRVLTYGEDLSMNNWRSALTRVKAHDGVVAAAPFVHAQALVTKGRSYGEAVMVMGLEPIRRGVVPVTSIRQTAKGGDFTFRTSSGDTLGVVIGKRLADRLYALAGSDSITLLSANLGRLDPVTGMPVTYQRKYEVTGVFETGMYEYDDRYLFMSLSAAQELAQLGDAVTGIEVRTANRDVAPVVARALADTLGFPFRTEDWQAQNSSLFHALKLEKLGMAFILLLIVLVAAFNIVSTLTMVVTDKTREIGILRAMGMPAESIRRIFFAQGVVIGLVGTTAGLVLGLIASVALDRYKLITLDPSVYFIDHLPVATQVGDVALIVLASLVIAALATLYPAFQAARLYPVEAIRHE
ncbi:MAG TPA: ABC transporter permease [Gemmatimonadaceae bacterium]|nr:ABC transporter permease [Gemmatimonadaceae bacterium]